VLVTSTVLRQVAGLFIVEDKGAHELKGAPAPVTLYRIARISGGRRRKGARLLTRAGRALAGDGQFVLIVGEPGIGKTRLVEEFRAQLADRPHSWIEWSSSQLCRTRRCIPS
jgi:predicted ATP-dependent serine protease